LIADLVVPTPGIHIVAWIALVAGISWFILFSNILRKEIQAAQPGSEAKPTSQSYKAVCFLCLLFCMVLGLIVDLGVILSGS